MFRPLLAQSFENPKYSYFFEFMLQGERSLLELEAVLRVFQGEEYYNLHPCMILWFVCLCVRARVKV